MIHLSIGITLLAGLVSAQSGRIKSFSVGPDQTLTYPNVPTNPPYLEDLPDEHTTLIPPAAAGGPYTIFGAAKLSGGSGGAVVLQSTDLTNFTFATSLGYNRQVFAPPQPINQCNPAYQTEFDGNYAAPGSVVQDPTLPPGNLIMIYEAENHCPGGVYNPEFYATIGFARSSDNGKTWPAPINGPSGGPARHPVLQNSIPQPTTSHPALGDAIPSAFVDQNASGDYYLYVVYDDHKNDGTTPTLRIARAKLGADPLTFLKWNNGSFGGAGIGGDDTGFLPAGGCPGTQSTGEISRNDDLGLYLAFFVCKSGPSSARLGAWYYSTAASLDLQDWSTPQMVENSQFPIVSPCAVDGRGEQFDGWYPSLMSPGAPAGHTKLTGMIFYQNGCDTGARKFTSRAFTITTVGPMLTPGSLANGATYLSGGLVPGSWAQVKGSGLSPATRIWGDSDFTGLGNNLPTNLSGVQVHVNNVPAAVYYIDAGQVSFQVPAGITGTASVQVLNNGQASNMVTAAAAASSPGIFPIIVNGVNYPAGVFLDGKYVGDPAIGPAFRKAKPGDVIQLYATALAATPAGVEPLQQIVNGVMVTIGSVTFPADFAALVAVGEFQINFTVPQQIADGTYPISIQVNGVSSPSTINSNPPGPVVLPIQR